MKNRPVVDKANQYKDVYGTSSSTTREFLTVFFSIVMIACAITCYFRGHLVPGLVFSGIFILLMISVYVSNRKKKIKYDPDNVNQGAIFKDHEE